MSPLGQILYIALLVFLLLLLFRLVMDYVFVFARSYRPQGFVAMALEVAYTVTDPPIKAVGKVLPPLRIGSITLDLAFMVVFFVTYVLMTVASGL